MEVENKKYIVDMYGRKWTKLEKWCWDHTFWSTYLCVVGALVIVFIMNLVFGFESMTEFIKFSKVILIAGVFLGLYRSFVVWLKGH